MRSRRLALALVLGVGLTAAFAANGGCRKKAEAPKYPGPTLPTVVPYRPTPRPTLVWPTHVPGQPTRRPTLPG